MKSTIRSTFRWITGNARRIRQDERGSSLLILGLAMTAMLVMAAFALDLGLAYLEAGRLQNAMDASALAAATQLPARANDPVRTQAIVQAAVMYAAKNGFRITADDVTLLTDGTDYVLGVSVEADSTIQTHLAGLVGLDAIRVDRPAEARIGVASSVGGAVPLSIERDYLNACILQGMTSHLTLKFGSSDGTEGFFGLVDLDREVGGGASDIETWLAHGYPGKVLSGDLIYPVEPGVNSGPCFKAFWSRFAECTHFPSEGGCNEQHYVLGCPRIVKVPIIVQTASKSVKIVGFAGFVLESCLGQGKDNYIIGSFTHIMEPDGLANGQDPLSCLDYGIYTAYLSR